MMKKTTLLSLFLLFCGLTTVRAQEQTAIDRTEWSLTCSSTQENGGIAAIKDGDQNTFWHSSWGEGSGESGLPQWFIVDLGEDKELSAFGYQKRTKGKDGATAYKLYVRTADDGNFIFGDIDLTKDANANADDITYVRNTLDGVCPPMKTGSLSSTTNSEQKVTFDTPVTGRYVMFVITANGMGDYTNCAEFNLYQANITDAEDALNASRIVGVSASQGLYEALKNALDTYKSDKTSANFAVLREAYTAFEAAEEKLQIADGKAYLLVNLAVKTGQKDVYLSAGSATANVETFTEYTGNTETSYPATAKFIARHIEGEKYAFVNGAYNTYLQYKGTRSTTYSTDYSVITVTKDTDYNEDGVFKLVTNRADIPKIEDAVMIVNKSVTPNVWDAYSADSYNCRGKDYSICFRLVEVADPRPSVNVTAPLTVEGKDYHLATYSNHFPTVVPAGIKAYVAADSGNGVVSLQKVADGDEKQAIPANTGVLLVSENGGETLAPAQMKPAAGEGHNDFTTNLFEPTGNTGVTVDAGVNAYILAKKTVNEATTVGFYKLSSTSRTIGAYRAYLVPSVSGNVSALRISFGDFATEIEGVEAAESAAAGTIYDLSGRRVHKAGKGIFIVNGKKVIR